MVHNRGNHLRSSLHKLTIIVLVFFSLVTVTKDASADFALPSWAGQATSTVAGVFNIPSFLTFCPLGGLALSGVKASAAQLIFGSDSGATGVFTFMMPCLGDLIRDTADDFIADFYPDIAGLITYVLTIAIILFGIAMATGGLENFKRDAITFIFKICFAVGLTQNLGWILEQMFNIQDGLIEAVTGTITTGSFLTGFSLLHCNMVLDIWMRADCIINLVTGIRVPAVDATMVTTVVDQLATQAQQAATAASSGNPPEPLTAANAVFTTISGGLTSGGNLGDGILAFIWNCLMSGGALSWAGLTCLYAVFNLFLGLLKAANIYLMSMMAMAFMAIIGGIILPLMVMRSTYLYFDKWARNFLSITLQPIMLFAFLNVSMTAFDIALISGQYSLMRVIAGDAVKDGITVNSANYDTLLGAQLYSDFTDPVTGTVTKAGTTIDSALLDKIKASSQSSIKSKFTLNQYAGTAVAPIQVPVPLPAGSAGPPAMTTVVKTGLAENTSSCFFVDLNLAAYDNSMRMLEKSQSGPLVTPVVAVPGNPDALAKMDKDRLNDATDYSMCIPYKVVNSDVLAAIRSPQDLTSASDKQGTNNANQYTMEVVGAAFMLALTAFVFQHMLDLVPKMSKKITGGGDGATIA
jgi:hypothetical protein